MRDKITEIADWLLRIRKPEEVALDAGLPCFLAASDLHGNVHRLREILAIARREAIEHVYLVGDLYSGPGGWEMYRYLRAQYELDPQYVTLLWGNHEVAFVAGMLGNDRQLRFFVNYGGREIVAGANAERIAHGDVPLSLNGSPRLSANNLAVLRADPELREMCRWIQLTHRMSAIDPFGTGYLHTFPTIDRHGSFAFQHRGQAGWEALPLIEQDLRAATRSDDPVFSPLLQTPTSPVWALFEIASVQQFQQATRSSSVRQIVYGHRHKSEAINVGNFNRQIGIAVDFDQGLGGFLVVSLHGLRFHQFVDRDSHQLRSYELVHPARDLSASETRRLDVEENLFGQFLECERQQFQGWPAQSAQARREFEYLQLLGEHGLPRIHRLYAELHPYVNDPVLRSDMFAAAVASSDEDAFRSFIHLLFRQTRELAQYEQDRYSPQYLAAKAIATVLLTALHDMPLARLGLLDTKLRGTTTRVNLTELYQSLLKSQDPDLAILAVRNLGTLRTPEAGVALRRAFLHDVRKVRVHAAETLASAGEVAYPLVVPLLQNDDPWVQVLAMWTLAEMAGTGPARSQAIRDLRGYVRRHDDWFLCMTGRELLRRLGDREVDAGSERAEIPNLTSAIVQTLQEIVDSQSEPFRRAFKVYFITIELSSLVYRRGLVGLDLDDLRIYVNTTDYFPPYYRHYKSGDVDTEGRWRGWRRLWIRCETPNFPDGPQIIALPAQDSAAPPSGRRSMVLYDHRVSNGRVQLPPLADVVAEHGLGKIKDRVRHALLEHWYDAFSFEEQRILSRVHAAALLKMLFDLPAEMHASAADRAVLQALSRKTLPTANGKPKRVIRLVPAAKDADQRRIGFWMSVHPQWVDTPKYSVQVCSAE